jgi:hypothetical protein
MLDTDSEDAQSVELEDLYDYRYCMPNDEVIKSTPKEIRKGRLEVEKLDWDNIVRSYNPNTIGLPAPCFFWLGLTNRLTDLYPYNISLDEDTKLDYSPDVPERIYANDSQILRAFEKPVHEAQIYSTDSRGRYIYALITQGYVLNRRKNQAEEEEKETAAPEE